MIAISLRRGRSTVGVHRCFFAAHQRSWGKGKEERGAGWWTAQTLTVARREKSTHILGREERKPNWITPLMTGSDKKSLTDRVNMSLKYDNQIKNAVSRGPDKSKSWTLTIAWKSRFRTLKFFKKKGLKCHSLRPSCCRHRPSLSNVSVELERLPSRTHSN